ncbi:MAG TPA: O-antigen ligase domain-containing protein [Candidatus Scalindua sp.]|nr:O-antigen ligase domain-containing protein [Candidatus Scalindua sp.]
MLYIIVATVCGTSGIFLLKHANTTFDAPKLAFMFIGTSIACIFWAIKGFENGIFHKTKGVNLALLIYLLACITSMVFSFNWVISFFGGYKQHGGVLSLLIYLAFFYLSANFINTRNIKIVFRSLIIFSIFVCIYGILPFVNIATYDYLPMYGRVYSTLGQPVYFGCFLAMMIPVVLFEIVRTKKLYLYGVLLLLIFCIFIAKARSGLIATLLVSIPLLFVYRSNRNFKIIALSVIAAMLIAGAFITSEMLNGINLYERFTRPVDYSPRLELYTTSLKAGFTFPILGIGQDIIRPHNIFLGHFAKLGIIGLISFCYLVYCAVKSFLQINKAGNHNLFYTLLAVCLVYLIFRQFNPAYIPVTLLFSMFGGAIYGIKNSSNHCM